VTWPLVAILVILILSGLPAYVSYRRRERMAAKPADPVGQAAA
jgi:hypothetical protein